MRPRVRRSRRILGLGLGCGLALGALACTSVGGAVRKEGPAAKQTLEALGQAAGDVVARAPVTADAVTATSAGMVLDTYDVSSADVLVTYLEDLAAPGELGYVIPRVKGSKVVATCASLLDHQTKPWDPLAPEDWQASVFGDDTEKTLRGCGRARYALVLRTMKVVQPRNLRAERRMAYPSTVAPLDAGAARDAGRDAGAKPAVKPGILAMLLDGGRDAAAEAGAPASETWVPALGMDDLRVATCPSASTRCRFDGGYVKTEVHVFALRPLAHQGAFVFEAESKDAVTFLSYATPNDLTRDFENQATTAFVAAVKKNLPGVLLRGYE